MFRRICTVLLALATVSPAFAATQSEVDAWLASAPQIIRTNEHLAMSNLHVRVAVRGTTAGGYVNPEIVQRGYLANGQEVMIIPLPSGGSGGVFTTLLFTTYGGRKRFVGYVPSRDGHLSVTLEEGSFLIRTPIYGVGDANCCPSRHHYERATLRGIRLVTFDKWDAS